MKYKKSKISVVKNSKIWSKNFTNNKDGIEKCKVIQDVEIPLSELNKIPKEKIIIGRFNALAKTEKYKKDRYVKIANELLNLWTKFYMRTKRLDLIKGQIMQLVLCYQKSLKRPNGSHFQNNFDITSKAADLQSKPECNPEVKSDSDSSLMFDSDHDDDENYIPNGRHKPSKMSLKPAVTLVTEAKLSTRKAATICQHLAKSGITISTPSQAGIYKAVMKTSEQREELYKSTLKNQDWCLHFDGKKIGKKEIQVVVLKNSVTEIKLAVLVLDNGKSVTIFNGIKDTLTKFNLWSSIKMVVCDTTSVNTGNKNGVVTLLKKHFQCMSLPPPQYIGCQHHVLDLILRHVMDDVLDGKTSSPNIAYHFVTDLVENYENLKSSYKQNEVVPTFSKINWRDDMMFLYSLCQSYKYFQKNNIFPYINFKSLPSISNARWNSRAILAILAYILLPNYQDKLKPICDFVCDSWFEIWFGDHCFKENNFEALSQSLTFFTKANECFLRHWVREPSKIKDHQRSNICAERAIKVVQDIYPLCKTIRTLNLKFISYNS